MPGEQPAPGAPAKAPVEPPITAAGSARLWVWEAMGPVERVARMQELGEWTAWLVRTFALESQVGVCWFLHPEVVEHMTALYLGWIRTYALPAQGKVPERIGELDWLARLHAMIPYLATRGCGRGHEERVSVPWIHDAAVMAGLMNTDAERRAQEGKARAPANPGAVEMARYQNLVATAAAGQRAKGGAEQSAAARPRQRRLPVPAPAPAAPPPAAPDSDPATLARRHDDVTRDYP